MPIGQQHTQHVAEARSALARGALMASTRSCAIVYATRRLPRRQAALRQRQAAWPELFFSARARGKLLIDRASAMSLPAQNDFGRIADIDSSSRSGPRLGSKRGRQCSHRRTQAGVSTTFYHTFHN